MPSSGNSHYTPTSRESIDFDTAATLGLDGLFAHAPYAFEGSETEIQETPEDGFISLAGPVGGYTPSRHSSADHDYHHHLQAGASPSQTLPMMEPDNSNSDEQTASPDSLTLSYPFGASNGMKEDKNGFKEEPEIMNEDTDLMNGDAAMDDSFDFNTASATPATLEGSPNANSPPLQFTYHGLQMRRNPFSPYGHTSSSSEIINAEISSPPLFAKSPPQHANAHPMLSGAFRSEQWSHHLDLSKHDLSMSLPNAGISTLAPSAILASPPSENRPPHQDIKPVFTLHPTRAKSRVETQIAVKMTLYPMPPGVKKLHLPPETIGKTRLQSRPPPQKSPDMLELSTVLVCSSAMEDDRITQRVLDRAAGHLASADDQSEDDMEKPLNGGPVKICQGCINRERKRADRKKEPKNTEAEEAEEAWRQGEDRRVIVFNTNEIKDWHDPTPFKPDPKLDPKQDYPNPMPPIPPTPQGAMQVDAPMRIACYCRHQSEKLGFKVVFTLRDHEDNVLAQAITNNIVITDDHKADKDSNSPPPLANGQPFIGENAQPSDYRDFAPGPSSGPSSANINNTNSFRHSYSANDLQNIQHHFGPHFMHNTQTSTIPQADSQSSSRIYTPPSLSRQPSPSGPSGPSAKRRKASGKVPNGLMMTTLDNAPCQPVLHMPSGNSTSSVSNTPVQIPGPSSLTQAYGSVTNQPYRGRSFPRSLVGGTAPPTPIGNSNGSFNLGIRSQSMENIPVDMFSFSAPNSAHPSRAQSPNDSSRNNFCAFHQSPDQMNQIISGRSYDATLGHIPNHLALINKVVPCEGPLLGAIEVICLGSGFRQGMEVMFGGRPATTTTFWGESCLCALLPPAAQAGPVSVTFKHEHPQNMQMQHYPAPPPPKQQSIFTYIDNSENDVMKHALVIVGNKVSGEVHDAGSIARSIVQGHSPWSAPNATHGQGSSQHRRAASLDLSMLGSTDIEMNLIRCLDIIDIDESPYQPHLNLRKSTGQTILMLASSLGMSRFVAGLIARGVNVDSRDRGGFTALHFASLYARPQIVRRLLIGGADPTIDSVRGYRPADMTSSIEVLEMFQNFERQAVLRRARAKPLDRPRSAASLKSVWRSSSPQSRGFRRSDISDLYDDETDDSDDASSEPRGKGNWARSRGCSRRSSDHMPSIKVQQVSQCIDEPTGLDTSSTAVLAWRDQLANQIQSFQQHVPWNLPNLQIPALPLMPNIPGYQTSPMVRRISSLVPHKLPVHPSTSSGLPLPREKSRDVKTKSRESSPPGKKSRDVKTKSPESSSSLVPTLRSKESEYRWSELFSTSLPPPPPAYDEIFPDHNEAYLDTKKMSAVRAAADAALDQNYAEKEETDEATVEGSTISARHEFPAGKNISTKEEQEALRAAHARKVKRIRSDRNLFFFWLPLLIVIVIAMLKNWIPDILHFAHKAASFVQARAGERLVDTV